MAHWLYEAARKTWQDVQGQQIRKGEEKYPTPLGDAGLTFDELYRHFVQENVDQMHYATALAAKYNEATGTINGLECRLHQYREKVRAQEKLIESNREKIGELVEERNRLSQLYEEATQPGPTTPGRPFKIGDRIRRKNGKPFSTKRGIAEVYDVDYAQGAVKIKDGGFLLFDMIEIAPKPAAKSIKQLCEEAYENASAKGWHNGQRSIGELIVLMHSELSEALEDTRNGHGFNDVWYEEDGKPCGVLSELADVVIRIFDACGLYNADLEGMIYEKMAYNATRPHRHGGKKL